MGRIFGTDGARGVAGEDLTTELAVNIGRAAAMVLAAETGKRPLFVIGKDTRISSDMLEAAVSAGLCSVGADVLLLGVVPTPAVAYLVKLYGADAGVMLSASHNPYEFNGIKLFGPEGFKLTDEEEERIEAIILDGVSVYDVKQGAQIGRVRRCESAVRDYVDHLALASTGIYPGQKLLVDCSNGSASATAPLLFERLGVSHTLLHDQPDGLNINDRCGSTHVELLSRRVVEGRYTMGLAFDGDADRLLAVDETGETLDGDHLLSIFADFLASKGALRKNTVAVTSMTNLGFFRRMEEQGYRTEVTKVGDRYVLENMRENGLSLGGEQSGHMIFLNYASTGDGQLSAVMLLEAVRAAGKPLSQLRGLMKKYPQTMKNVRATPSMKADLDRHPAVLSEIRRWDEALSGRGRIVVRASGTEPLIRVMVEGESPEEIEQAAGDIAAAIKEHLI